MRVLDAVVLAGEKQDSIPVRGGNKAFLPFRDSTLLGLVIAALGRAETIGSITVVGPSDRLTQALAGAAVTKPLRILEQGPHIFANIMIGALSTFAEYSPGMTAEELKSVPGIDLDKAVVMFTSDMPMIDPREIDAFVTTAPLGRADLIYGFTHLETLLPYEPHDGKPGIKFIYGCAADRIMRHGNIAIYRPLKLAPSLDQMVQTIYSLRYQRYLSNVFRALLVAFRYLAKPRVLGLFVMIQLSSWLHNHGHHRLREIVRKPLTMPFNEAVTSELFETPFATHMTIGPGLTLDVDDEESYQAFLTMIDEWREIQRTQIEAAQREDKKGPTPEAPIIKSGC